VVALNRAAAVGELEGPEAALQLIDALLEQGALEDYRFTHGARAEFARRAGQLEQARRSYARALELTRQEPERRFLERRLHELSSPHEGGKEVKASC
jgi:RNA polymerase sigma-70 factor (ECF subfamily)